MLATEAEAKKTWCPYAMFKGSNRHPTAHSDMAAFPDAMAIGDSCRCIASMCRAWQWHHPSSTTHTGTPDELVLPSDAGPMRLIPRPPNKDPHWQRVEDKNQFPGWSSWKKDNFDRATMLGYCGAFEKHD